MVEDEAKQIGTDQADAWQARLEGARDAYLSVGPLDVDGSGSPKALAQRVAIGQIFPLSVTLYENDGLMVARLDTTADEFRLVRKTPDPNTVTYIAKFKAENLLSEEEPGSRVIWLGLDEAGTPRSPLMFAFERVFAWLTEDELARRRDVYERACNVIGWRDPKVPVPDGRSDPRIAMVARPTRDFTAAFRKLAPDDLVNDATSAGRTLNVVPDNVEAVARTARLLYVRGWHQWEFLTLAKREAIMALEASLRLLRKETGTPGGTFEQLINTIGSDGFGHRLLSNWERERAHFPSQDPQHDGPCRGGTDPRLDLAGGI